MPTPNNTRVAGNLTTTSGTPATGISATLICSMRDFLLKIGGTFVGTVDLQIFNEQANEWQTIESYTTKTAKVIHTVAWGQQFRLICSAFTSGTIAYELDAPNDI